MDDFALEVESLKNNPEFMAFLRQLSQKEGTISLQDLRKELALEEGNLSVIPHPTPKKPLSNEKSN